MKRPVRILLLTVLLAVTCGAYFFRGNSSAAAKDAAQKQDADRLSQFQRDLPLGTQRSIVIAYLSAHKLPENEEPSSLTLHIRFPQRPATVWYCSTFEPYADFSFHVGGPEDAPLKQITMANRGIDCL